MIVNETTSPEKVCRLSVDVLFNVSISCQRLLIFDLNRLEFKLAELLEVLTAFVFVCHSLDERFSAFW